MVALSDVYNWTSYGLLYHGLKMDQRHACIIVPKVSIYTRLLFLKLGTARSDSTSPVPVFLSPLVMIEELYNNSNLIILRLKVV